MTSLTDLELSSSTTTKYSVGYGASASANSSVAIGDGAMASAIASVAIGPEDPPYFSAAQALDEASAVLGVGAVADVGATCGVAIGAVSYVSGANATAIGPAAHSSGDSSMALGGSAYGDFSISISSDEGLSSVIGNYSGSFGYDAYISGNYSYGIGNNVRITGDNSISINALDISGAMQTISGNNTVAFISHVQAGRTLSVSNAVLMLGNSLIVDPSTSGGSSITAVRSGVDFGRAHDALIIPIGTNAQQPGQTGQPAAVNGMIRYDSDTDTFQGYIAGSWKTFTLT
jgi:trimeric autotransporter adhesin